jgi:hypothetical protein
MLTVVTSGKASPGVTASTWALALGWPRPVLAADCDPASGDMAAGLLAGRVSQDRGLLSWSSAARRGVPALAAAELLAAHSVELPEQPSVWLLPGFTNATQGYSFTPEVWERLALAFERAESAISRDVVVDTGRVVGDRGNWPLIHAADHVLVAVRPSLRSVHAAQEVVHRLRVELGDLAKVSALVIGEGPYSPLEVVDSLGLRLSGTLPTDRGTAAVLTDGASMSPRGLHRSSLLKASAGVAQCLSSLDAPDSTGISAAEVTI